MNVTPAKRAKLPEIRAGLTRRVVICGHKCYVTVTFFDDGKLDDGAASPAEIFVAIAKQGSTVAGLMDGVAILISRALQYGIPWDDLKKPLLGQRFEDNGDTEHSSLLDGLAKTVDAILKDRVTMLGMDELPHKN
jgi:ribonucleoside-diphosphate reductase alpha chain